MDKKVQKIIFAGLGFLPIVLLLISYNKSPECFIALGICNLAAIIANGLGNIGEFLERKERRILFLTGIYFSLFAVIFLGISVLFALQEHIDKLLIYGFVSVTLILLIGNIHGILKYRK